CIASLLPLAQHDATAKLDPLRIVTSQIVRPNILVVLDTSGSLSMRPETSNWPSDIVGGDCYNGTNCTTTQLANTCTNGQTCGAANTCFDGVSPCTPGTNGYCADGTTCYQGRLCGSGANQYECPSQIATCANGSACQHLCQDGTSLCTSNGNCPS